MSEAVHRGGCLCGAIRFEIGPRPGRPHTCSCSMCRRHTGSLTAAWVEFDRDEVKWVGSGGQPSTWRSSEGSSRIFCPACGSSIGAIDDAPIVALLVGVFDEPNSDEFRPRYHSFEEQRPGWWKVDTGPVED